MFDVIHVIYEEDITPLWEQHIDVKDRVREVLYPMLYDHPYRFSSTKPQGASAGAEGWELQDPAGLPEGIGPDREVKPYIPPTDPEDLMKVLDAPMGG